MLSDSATHLERKLIRAHVITDSIVNTENNLSSSTRQQQSRTPETILEVGKPPPPAVGKTDTASASDKIAHKPSTADVAASKPAAPAQKSRPATVKDSSTREPVRVAAKQPAAIARNKHGSEEQHPAKSLKTGAWVINLASLPSQAEADQIFKRPEIPLCHRCQCLH